MTCSDHRNLDTAQTIRPKGEVKNPHLRYCISSNHIGPEPRSLRFHHFPHLTHLPTLWDFRQVNALSHCHPAILERNHHKRVNIRLSNNQTGMTIQYRRSTRRSLEEQNTDNPVGDSRRQTENNNTSDEDNWEGLLCEVTKKSTIENYGEGAV